MVLRRKDVGDLVFGPIGALLSELDESTGELGSERLLDRLVTTITAALSAPATDNEENRP